MFFYIIDFAVVKESLPLLAHFLNHPMKSSIGQPVTRQEPESPTATDAWRKFMGKFPIKGDVHPSMLIYIFNDN